MTNHSYGIWRTLLFVPADKPAFIEKAHTRGADAIILDLEDSIPCTEKEAARSQVSGAVHALHQKGLDVLVRVNVESLQLDISAACVTGLRAIVLPKVDGAESLVAAHRYLDGVEKSNALAPGSVKILAQIEHVSALPQLDAITNASDRLLGMSLGSEDFSVSAGAIPTPDTLYWPNQQVAFACRRAGISPFGFPDSIALIRETESLQCAAEKAAAMGMVGALCIHPDQVAILNKAFTPDDSDIAEAEVILAAYAQAQKQGKGVFEHRGKMVDLPVIHRAQEILARSSALKPSNT